ncbi:MAG: hypothetical protein REI45_08000, partial [Propionicimonas sp.]|nr:hypothetical protein [Propionicimonas sp.]
MSGSAGDAADDPAFRRRVGTVTSPGQGTVPRPGRTSGDRVARAHQQWLAERPDVDTTPMLVIARLHRVALRLTEELVA